MIPVPLSETRFIRTLTANEPSKRIADRAIAEKLFPWIVTFDAAIAASPSQPPPISLPEIMIWSFGPQQRVICPPVMRFPVMAASRVEFTMTPGPFKTFESTTTAVMLRTQIEPFGPRTWFVETVTFDPPVTEIPKPRNTDAVTPTWFDRSKSAAVAFTWATWTRSEFRTVIPATPSAVFTYSAWASVTFAR